jgi:hypothetical protein
MLMSGGGDEGAKSPLVHNEQAMLVQPAARETQEPLSVIGAHEFLAQCTHERSTLVFAQPAETERLTSLLLVFDQRRCTPVHRSKGGRVWSGNTELLTEMAPQQRRIDSLALRLWQCIKQLVALRITQMGLTTNSPHEDSDEVWTNSGALRSPDDP